MRTTTDVNWLSLRATTEPGCIRAGEVGQLIIDADIPAGGHIESATPPEPYLIPTVLEISGGDGMEFGPVQYPAAQEKMLLGSPVRLSVLMGTVRFVVPFTVSKSAPVGSHRVTARLRYQACERWACLPPNTQTVDAIVRVRAERQAA